MKDSGFPYKNAFQYLQATGVLENGLEKDIESARKEFRKLYQANYWKRYANENARVTLCFTCDEKVELEKLARRHDKKLATFFKQIIRSATQGDFSKVQALEQKMVQVGTLSSLAIDEIEELIFEYPKLERNLNKLVKILNKIEQILQLQ